MFSKFRFKSVCTKMEQQHVLTKMGFSKCFFYLFIYFFQVEDAREVCMQGITITNPV